MLEEEKSNDDKKLEESKYPKITDPKPPERGPLEGIYPFKVNDVELESSHKKLVALDILKFAKDKGAFPGEPDDYLLQGDKQQYKPYDWVDLKIDNRFFTIPIGPTEVA